MLVTASVLGAADRAFGKGRDCETQGAALRDGPCARATPGAAGASAEDAARAAEAAARARRLAERADYQLLFKYPDLTTYQKLMAAEVRIVMGHIAQAMARLDELRVKRKRLDQKLEFHPPFKPLPPDLQLELDQSEAAFTASARIFRGLEQDIAYIVDKYRRPRERLEKLWVGAQMGSMGLYDPDAAASAPRQ